MRPKTGKFSITTPLRALAGILRLRKGKKPEEPPFEPSPAVPELQTEKRERAESPLSAEKNGLGSPKPHRTYGRRSRQKKKRLNETLLNRRPLRRRRNALPDRPVPIPLTPDQQTPPAAPAVVAEKSGVVPASPLKKRREEPIPAKPKRSTAKRVRPASGALPVVKPPEAAAIPVGPEIPDSYQETYLHAIARDPHHIYAFWELAPGASPIVRGREKKPCPVLRLIAVDSGVDVHVADYTIEAGESQRYVAVPPSNSGRYRLEVGFRSRSGDFRMVCASNEVELPRFSEPAPRQKPAPIHEYLRQKISLPDLPAASSTEVTVSAGSLDFMPEEATK